MVVPCEENETERFVPVCSFNTFSCFSFSCFGDVMVWFQFATLVADRALSNFNTEAISASCRFSFSSKTILRKMCFDLTSTRLFLHRLTIRREAYRFNAESSRKTQTLKDDPTWLQTFQTISNIYFVVNSYAIFQHGTAWQFSAMVS